MPSSFVVGSLYQPRWNGIAWSQPGGVGTQVFPTQNVGNFQAYPVSGQMWAETGLWTSPCLHWFDSFLIQRDFDEGTQMSVAIQMCPICSLIIRIYEPYDLIYQVPQFAISV